QDVSGLTSHKMDGLKRYTFIDWWRKRIYLISTIITLSTMLTTTKTITLGTFWSGVTVLPIYYMKKETYFYNRSFCVCLLKLLYSSINSLILLLSGTS